MTDRPRGAPHSGPGPADEGTRDIRLPPLAGRPAAHVPAQWAGAGGRGNAPVHQHEPPLQEQPVQELPAQPPGAPAAAGSSDPDPTVVVAPVAPPPDPTVVLQPQTDGLSSSSREREKTRRFVPPPEQLQQQPRVPAVAAPADRKGSRTSTWVLMILLPILVIAAAGILLFLLFTGA